MVDKFLSGAIRVLESPPSACNLLQMHKKRARHARGSIPNSHILLNGLRNLESIPKNLFIHQQKQLMTWWTLARNLSNREWTSLL